MSSNSSMAAAIKDFSITTMAPQDVSKEEVDAILNYVDNYVEPVEVVTTTDEGVALPEQPNYENRLMLFYVLLVSILFLLIALLILSGSIKALLRSDQLKEGMARRQKADVSGGLKTLLLLVVFAGFFSNSSFGFQYALPEAGADIPWIKVDTFDLYFLLGINIMLIGVVLYLKSMFNSFMSLVREETEEETEAEAGVLIKKVSRILTDAVEIEEEHTILMEHEYDGIRELDNNLPPWWVWGFYATIVFAVVYLFNYHVFKTGDLQIAEYTKEMKRSELAVQAYLNEMAMNVDETNVTLLTDPADLSKGSKLFQANCIVCHGPTGAGDIGPNLTDKQWIYGFDIATAFATIKNGTSNGMPEHKSKLNPIELQQVASYILSMPEKAGKEAEGEIEEK
jgi:cytochrome c oxidase cbb3-type subunit 3